MSSRSVFSTLRAVSIVILRFFSICMFSFFSSVFIFFPPSKTGIAPGRASLCIRPTCGECSVTSERIFHSQPLSINAPIYCSPSPSPAIPAPIHHDPKATVATGGQMIAAGARIIAYALNGSPSIPRSRPNQTPPLFAVASMRS